MPPRCCVPMCKTSGGHRFPRDVKRQKEWLKAICRDSLSCIESARVCRNHFVPGDYFKHKIQGRSLLKKNAVPSVFVWSTNTIFEDKKDKWRQTKVVYPLKRSRRLIQKNNRVSEKDKMSAVKEENGDCDKTIKDKDISGNIIVQPKSDSETLSFTISQPVSLAKNCDQMSECRACLKKMKDDKLYGLFQGWAPMWGGLGPTIAEDLSNLSNVELSESDGHSKFICYSCCDKLWTACHFKMLVQDNDRLLRQRLSNDSEKVWPKPIQLDKNINGVYENSLPFNVDIKQEVLSDEEASNMEEGYTDINFMEIKVEPEEIVQQSPIIVNGVTSLNEFPNREIPNQLINGDMKPEEELLKVVKEEPVSDVEEMELSLECLLCSRSFHSVTGLKAHVIAQHSYQTVARKEGEDSPHRTSDKHVCATCRRTFTTSTDLMVHETCHNKHVCYGCSGKFETFVNLTLHRKLCKALVRAEPKRHKTLDDVKRQPADDKIRKNKSREINNVIDSRTNDESKHFSCPLCNEIFTDTYYVKIHQEIHHSKEKEEVMESDSNPMEVEMLESIFSE